MNNNGLVLVTGGAGYVGSVLTSKLLNLGFKARIIDTFLYNSVAHFTQAISGGQSPFGPHILPFDFREPDKVVCALWGTRPPRAVIHLGAIVGDFACQLYPKLTIETNLIATRQLAQLAKAFGVKRFIFASTCSVYGSGNGDHPLSEDEPLSSLRPISLYASTKLYCEKLLLAMQDQNFQPVILRFATIYGLSKRPRFDLVVNRLAAKAIAEKKITLFGGKQWRPFVAVSDVCEAIIKTLLAPKELVSGQIFNVGSSEQNYQIEQIAAIIKELLPDTEIQKSDALGDRRNYVVKFDKIKTRLQFLPSQTIKDGIIEIIKAFDTKTLSDYRAPKYDNYLALKSGLTPIKPSVFLRFNHFKPIKSASDGLRETLLVNSGGKNGTNATSLNAKE